MAACYTYNSLQEIWKASRSISVNYLAFMGWMLGWKSRCSKCGKCCFPSKVNLSRWVCNGYSTDDSYDPGLGYITGYYQGNYHGR